MLLSHSENSGISNTSPRKRLMASPGESGQRRQRLILPRRGRKLADVLAVHPSDAQLGVKRQVDFLKGRMLESLPAGRAEALHLGPGRIVGIEIDDDGLFRHRDLSEKEEEADRIEGGRSSTEFERQAARIDQLDHRGVAGRVIEFEGTLGLIIGGGGASLTAFDAVQQQGGKPANYCEIGGNPSVLKVQELTRGSWNRARSHPRR